MSAPKRPRGPIAATDFVRLQEERLANDPILRAEFETDEVERAARAQVLRDAEQPIVIDLRRVGVDVASVWDLVNSSEPYPNALPVLLDHLERGGYPDRVMESLGRALAVKPTVAWWDRVKARYLAARSPGEKEGTAVALAACATKAQLGDLIGFLDVADRGESRIYFLRPIKRLGGESGRALLESLRDDPTFGKEATALLRVRRKK